MYFPGVSLLARFSADETTHHVDSKVQYLPEWFPGATFHRTAAKSRQLVKEMRELPFNVVKERIVR